MSTIKKQRDPRIDALKGALILLVVLGHCIGHDSSFRLNMTGYNYIYLFHMPMFVFMSGYFTRLGNDKKFWNRILSFVYIYVFWQVAKSLYLGRSFVEMVVKPSPMMWYLLSLIVWCVVYWLSQKISSKITSKFLVGLCLVAALIAGFIPQVGAPFALSRTLVFAPFFFLGVSLQKVNFMEVCNRVPYWIAIALLVTVFAFLYILNINIAFIVRGVMPYPESMPIIGFVGRALYYNVAIIMSIALIRMVLPNKYMTIVGRDTMKYYIFHGVILMFMYQMPIPWSFVYGVFYWMLISVALFFFNKLRVSDYILNPIGNVVNALGWKNN